MNFIEQKVELIPQEQGILGVYSQIEKAGRVCYLSEPKGEPKAFVKMLTEKQHYSPLEHGTVYLSVVMDNVSSLDFVKIGLLKDNKYTQVIFENDLKGLFAYITTNYRVIVENNLQSLVIYRVDNPYKHERRYTFHIITSIGIAREIMRHRNFSYCQESTRWINYNKKDIEFIKPYWYETTSDDEKHIFENYIKTSEITYKQLISAGLKAQDARDVLPLDTKTELYMTGFKTDWEDFINKRNIPQAHPMAREIAQQIEKQI